MPPKPKGTSPTVRKRYCGLGNHHLRPPLKTISDERILRFARHINNEIRRATPVCGSCYDTLVSIYHIKVSHAIDLQKGKRRAAAANTNSISDVSNSQQLPTTSAPLHSSSSSVSAYSTTDTTDSSNLPSTSTAKRKRHEPQPTNPVQQSTSSDDDEQLLSLNAVNGTRLPNVQPIPKRRQFVSLNKDVMDIYLNGTTGG
ncbi:uncharacterized protein LOC6566407 [Drosophila grimshawi]|uniref:GH13489 n=1 Tax=Drosophila grimshawi TaxID=7222 RepID=B4JPB8_DROGR|nr:uncharacterized protein LOC6566407 [Drosophila grimshawi]EDV98748.1 GH13489 [Drosophila grimshawi]